MEHTAVIAIAGNPNVGKSTIFNALTGLNQHTGNWVGKTVTNAKGHCHSSSRDYLMIDLPGTYSLLAHSAEEETARNFLCFDQPDAVLVVCDATCLERNLNLVLQIQEITPQVMVCVNLMDEAAKKHIRVNLEQLSRHLGIPVTGTNAREKKSISRLLKVLDSMKQTTLSAPVVSYPAVVESALSILETGLAYSDLKGLNPRWLSLKLLDCDENFRQRLAEFLGYDLWDSPEVSAALSHAWNLLDQQGIDEDTLKDCVVSALVHRAEEICLDTVSFERENYNKKDRFWDQVFTSRWSGYPVMFLLFLGIFWLTITGANYPSQLLSQGLSRIEDLLTELFFQLHAPDWLHGILILGGYRVLAWVVSVMLPPMAIFFPLFTLLEDSGYLPRIAYNLDKPFQCCHSCGKQALTMCMEFCNL